MDGVSSSICALSITTAGARLEGDVGGVGGVGGVSLDLYESERGEEG